MIASTSPLIVAMYGGPGTGKSTTAALTFGALKQAGHNVELVTEYAKDCTWGEESGRLGHQAHQVGEMMWRFDRLNGKVDAIITDTSTLLSLVYLREGEMPQAAAVHFQRWLVEDWAYRNTMNVLLQRDPQRAYNPSGRSQTEKEAQELDATIRRLILGMGLYTLEIQVDKKESAHVEIIAAEAEYCINRRNKVG